MGRPASAVDAGTGAGTAAGAALHKTVALHFSGRETLTASAWDGVRDAMRRDDAYVVRSEDVCTTTLVHEPCTGAPVYHEHQVRDACASHAANALLGRHEVTVRDIEAMRERRCAREHPGENSVSGGGINFFELQELLAGRGEAIKLHSLTHTRIVDGDVQPYAGVGEWAEANVDTVTALLAKQRFLINAPGHYVAVTRVVHGDVDPYALVDSTLPWQTLYPPRRLVAHMLAAEAARTRATSAPSSTYATLTADVAVAVNRQWVAALLAANAPAIEALLAATALRGSANPRARRARYSSTVI